ncbi:MAG: aldo/keto reductase [Oscillospiraceae bacterium]|nr:aldo/keto reductase [Oscillospiraceae bacterium]
MEYRKFKDGLDISLLGFGTMRFPVDGEDLANINVEKTYEMLDHAFENGVNYFDTAYMYHNHASEAFLGKALARYSRKDFYLATKLPPWSLEKKEDMQRMFDGQLKRCGVDCFDFYLLHCITRSTLPIFERLGAYEFLREQQKKGKLRYLGFSIHDSAALMKEVLEKYEFDFGQIQLNYLDWDQLDSKGLYETLYSRKIPAIIMEPVRGGSLANLPERSAQMLLNASPERSQASWAMRFAGELPGVLTVLSGMSTLEQVKDNIATYTNLSPLTSSEHEIIRQAVEIYRKNAAIPCTTCNYCMPCPVGVNIPESFGVYNMFKNTGNRARFNIEYTHVGKGSQPEDCTSCGACLTRCPQQIDIPKEMEKIAQAYNG